MTSRDDIRAGILRYEDDELVQQAWDEFAAFEARDDVKEPLRRDIEDAERHLRDAVVLSGEGRGRLRNFLYTKRRQDKKR